MKRSKPGRKASNSQNIKPCNIKEEPLGLGKDYIGRKVGKNWQAIEIIQVRYNESKQQHEYYVHYEGCNRRLDEWLPRDRVKPSSCKTFTLDAEVKCEVGTSAAAPPVPVMSLNEICSDRRITRNQKRRYDEINRIQQQTYVEVDSAAAALEKEHEEITKVKYIDRIQIGKFEINTWYYSPYPEDFNKERMLWICEFCLKYMKLKKTYRYHLTECIMRKPPGKEIYREAKLAVYEVDGHDQKVYCQNLCLLSKFFLDHKTIHFAVTPFLFYILCEVDRKGAHVVGYFSKEKESPDGNNVACILVFPQYQRQGYGKLLISLSYELSKIEGTVGSPEQPLSDLGKRSYRSYWSWVLLETLKGLNGIITLQDLSQRTGFSQSDIIAALHRMDLLGYMKGEHVICIASTLLDEYLRSGLFKRPRLCIEPGLLNWAPPQLTFV